MLYCACSYGSKSLSLPTVSATLHTDHPVAAYGGGRPVWQVSAADQVSHDKVRLVSCVS